jgi:mannan endo-1,4-beta-mannosidase
VSHAHTWYTNQTGSFKDIKSLGANTVRVVLSSGHRWTENDAADVSQVISLGKSNRLICLLEVHDTTGYGEQGGAITPAQAAGCWEGIKSALVGHEDYINIGNEPYGNNNYSGWTTDTSAAVKKLRNAGLQHAIMVDAPNWGQDWAFVMRDNARTVASADPDHNTIFSIHRYGVFDTAAEVNNYLDTFVKNNLPIVVGEFGNNHSDGGPDEDTIMATGQPPTPRPLTTASPPPR